MDLMVNLPSAGMDTYVSRYIFSELLQLPVLVEYAIESICEAAKNL